MVKLLVSNGGDIYAESFKGLSPLSLVSDPTVRAEMIFLTRRPLLLFLEAVCLSEGVEFDISLHRVAGNSDLVRLTTKFI